MSAPDLQQPTLALAAIHAHPANPRHRAVADEEMVDSVRSLGILVPVTVAPAGDDQFVLIAGHRRYDAARKVGLDDAPVFVRDDLVTEAQQLEAMLVENLHREDLTVVEEAEAYEQLRFAGMDAAAIAKATGRKASTVKARLKLNTLADSTRSRLHAGDMTLLDAEAMLEFADDPEVTAELEEAIGTGNFRYKVTDARHARVRAAATADTIAGFVAAGAFEVINVPGNPGHVVRADVTDGEELPAAGMHMFPEDLRDPSAHDGCLAYRAPTSQYQDPYLLCTDRARHPAAYAATPPAQVDSEWEKRRADRDAERASREAASQVRMEWLREHFAAMWTVRGNTALIKAAQAFLPLAVVNDDINGLLPALGVTLEDGTDYRAKNEALAAYAAGLCAAKPAKVLAAFAGYLTALIADQLDCDMTYTSDADTLLHQLVLWDWLKAAGYQLSDVDREIRTQLEVRHTELVEGEAS